MLETSDADDRREERCDERRKERASRSRSRVFTSSRARVASAFCAYWIATSSENGETSPTVASSSWPAASDSMEKVSIAARTVCSGMFNPIIIGWLLDELVTSACPEAEDNDIISGEATVPTADSLSFAGLWFRVLATGTNNIGVNRVAFALLVIIVRFKQNMIFVEISVLTIRLELHTM